MRIKYLAEGARAAAVRLDRRHGLRKQLRAAKAVSICTFVLVKQVKWSTCEHTGHSSAPMPFLRYLTIASVPSRSCSSSDISICAVVPVEQVNLVPVQKRLSNPRYTKRRNHPRCLRATPLSGTLRRRRPCCALPRVHARVRRRARRLSAARKRGSWRTRGS
jgi:hypothetical protein